jgi:flagellar protein FliO/FliZ
MRNPRAITATLTSLLAATLGSAALAADGARFAAPVAASAREPVSAVGGVMQVVLSLAIVLGAILLLAWVARRLRVMPRGRSGALRIVDEVALGAKERAVILEVDGARLVLGVGEGRVTLLHRGDASAAPAAVVVDPVPSGTAPPRFADLLNKAIGR